MEDLYFYFKKENRHFPTRFINLLRETEICIFYIVQLAGSQSVY